MNEKLQESVKSIESLLGDFGFVTERLGARLIEATMLEVSELLMVLKACNEHANAFRQWLELYDQLLARLSRDALRPPDLGSCEGLVPPDEAV